MQVAADRRNEVVASRALGLTSELIQRFRRYAICCSGLVFELDCRRVFWQAATGPSFSAAFDSWGDRVSSPDWPVSVRLNSDNEWNGR